MSMIVFVIAVIAAIAAYSYYQRRFGRAANYSDMSKVYGLPAGEAPQTYIGGAFYSGPFHVSLLLDALEFVRHSRASVKWPSPRQMGVPASHDTHRPPACQPPAGTVVAARGPP